jgi:hypothetical protein
VKFAFGWILPGGVYLLKRRYDQFALCFALVAAGFAAGVALGGLNNPPQPGIFGAVAAVAQWFAGGPYLIARIFSHATLPIDAPIHNNGLALLMAAGAINLLAMADRD